MSKGTLHLNKNLESLSQLNGAEAKPLIVESDQPLEPILAAEPSVERAVEAAGKSAK